MRQVIFSSNNLNLKCDNCKLRNWRQVKITQESHKFGFYQWICKTCERIYITKFHIMDTEEYLGIEIIS
jgi:hypothetical protein